jgi:hypothetical protein
LGGGGGAYGLHQQRQLWVAAIVAVRRLMDHITRASQNLERCSMLAQE